MERQSNGLTMTVNERTFIKHSLVSDLRIDGRGPFDYRRLTIKFGREDGSSEVQLGQTHVMGFVTAQLVQPYRDRANEGTFSVFVEFSPMADPAFEAGRPGEAAVELGRVIDRGLRESRAVDMESLCVIAGKLVWAVRVDIHIIDNGGNLIDAANIAALAALLTFRRPECTVEGEDGQDVIVHPPEVREPLPLIIHHIPVAVTFAFFEDGKYMVIDPSHKEEAVMGGRMTSTINSNGDICAVQKAGGEGILSSSVMQCIGIASQRAIDITDKIKNAVEAYVVERALKKVKRHPPSVSMEVNVPEIIMREQHDQSATQKELGDSLRHHEENIKDEEMESCSSESARIHETVPAQQGATNGGGNVKTFLGGPLNWDPYSKAISPNLMKSTSNVSGSLAITEEQGELEGVQKPDELHPVEAVLPSASDSPKQADTSNMEKKSHSKSLRDAVKPKHRRKK
ncbi:hypothetical protein QJS10_CPB17g00495 [Acorus calamus]|uniref:Protein ECERIFERUM 7 n=1 Tax=Acorus calamus TaxID=4465 RepID=A0AAV9CQE8_ACOCL|nr:hypothetical protein QJS10_CPB17g00495 [Acorus calamus]